MTTQVGERKTLFTYPQDIRIDSLQYFTYSLDQFVSFHL